MSLIENSPKIVHKFPDLEDGFEEIGTLHERCEVWENESRKITLSVLGGTKEWPGVWVKEISMESTDPILSSCLMRVQIVKNEDTNISTKAVFVDVFRFDGEKGFFQVYAYSSNNEGKLEDMGITEPVTDLNISPLDYIDALVAEPARSEDELPERIDVEETIRLFLEQLEERRFDLPALVSAS